MKTLFTITAAVLLTASVFAQTPEKMSYQAVVRDASDNLVTSSTVGIQISILQGGTSGTPVYVELQFPNTNTNGLVTVEIGTGTVISGDFATIDWGNDTYFIKTETDPTGSTSFTITGTSQLLSVPYALHAKTADSITGTITETDPVFGSSVAGGITGTDTTNWNNKLDSYTETDPIFGSSVAGGITGTDTTNWNNKLDSYAEIDPVYGSSVASGITGADTTNWNNKLDTEIDGSVTNELQSLSISNDTIYLSNDGFVKLPADQITDADADSTNELQVLSFSNDTLFLSDGNYVLMPYDSAIWSINGSDIYYNSGNIGIGTTNPGAKLEVVGDFIRTIAYAQGYGTDNTCDVDAACGPSPLSTRVLTFTKRNDSTKVRVQYKDNMRSYGASGSRCCQWEIMFDGASCPSGVIGNSVYAAGTENTFRDRTIFGYCSGLSAGTYTIQVYVSNCSAYWARCFTGWPGTTNWTLEAEEVY